jgi:mono/diheme cytochrome c family protein
MFTHDVPDVASRLKDQRALNWSAVRGSNTDFNQNAIGIQGGTGFAKETATGDRSALVFNHGPVFGISDSLDALQEWATTIRAPIVPDLANEAAGRAVFDANCASCHGGAKWSKSQVTQAFLFGDAGNGLVATFPRNPIGAGFFELDPPVTGTPGVKPFDPALAVNGPQLLSITRDAVKVNILDDVGTFLKAGPLEIRGAAAVAGQSTQGFGAFGGAGFNSPSLLGLSMSAPYFHDGSAQTLEQVMAKHTLVKGGPTISTVLTAQQVKDVLDFVRSIDDNTAPSASEMDKFLEAHPVVR